GADVLGQAFTDDLGPAAEDAADGHLFLPAVLDQPGAHGVAERLRLASPTRRPPPGPAGLSLGGGAAFPGFGACLGQRLACQLHTAEAVGVRTSVHRLWRVGAPLRPVLTVHVPPSRLRPGTALPTVLPERRWAPRRSPGPVRRCGRARPGGAGVRRRVRRRRRRG